MHAACCLVQLSEQTMRINELLSHKRESERQVKSCKKRECDARCMHQLTA